MTGAPSTVITEAEVDGRRADVVITDGFVRAISPPGGGCGDIRIDAAGGSLIPGLHDHHVHLLALAAARRSVRCGPPAVTSIPQLAAALHGAPAAPAGWIRGVGYHESVAGDLDRHALDRLAPADRPCRIQHRSGHGWILNSRALTEVGLHDGATAPDGAERDRTTGRLTGRLYGLGEWLGARVPVLPVDLAHTGRELAGYGIIGLTDATASTALSDLDPLATAVRSGALPQRVVVTGDPALPPGADGLERGPAKIVVADHALPSIDDLVRSYRTARAAGRPVAVHCVTRVGLLLALAAWDEVGARHGDRIEHGAVVPVEEAARIAALGLTVVTQPSFVAERGDDYLREVADHDVPYLWRCAGLQRAGIAVAGSTDAPYGDADPWRAIAAAMERRTPSGAVLGAGERLGARAALDLFLTPLDAPGGPPRTVRVGAPADLVLLDAPVATVLRDPSSAHVRLTWRAGRPIAGPR